ncbi:MAG: NAD(P)H-dependent glycerol-3-phosphate dehydrogenase [Oligoflexales bacterium]
MASASKTTGGEKIIVFGGGNFGTGLAHHLAEKGNTVTILDRNPAIVESIQKRHINEVFLPDVKLSHRITAKTSLAAADFVAVRAIVLAVPSQFLRDVLVQYARHVTVDKLFISAVKGIENSTQLLPHGIVGDVLGKEIMEGMVALSGPSFAVEVVAKQPTAVVVAGKNKARVLEAQDLFHTPYFRAYSSDDPVGVEVAGALKNVVAVAAGACVGLEFQRNSLAALMTRGLAEITRLGVAMGAQPLTFVGLSGVGDLILTCSSEKSRNYRLGFYLSKGLSLEDVKQKLGSVAEGYTTARSAYELGRRLGVDTPIIDQVYEVLYQGKPIAEAVSALLTREAKSEL